MPVSEKPRKKRTMARPVKTVEVCYRGDLLAEFEEKQRELDVLMENRQTMADGGHRQRVATEIEALREQMRDETETWRLQGRTHTEYQAIVLSHPPRAGNKIDETLGYNDSTFHDELIRACLIEPKIPDEELTELLAEMSSGQFEIVAVTAINVSRRKVDVPFSYAASAALQSSSET